VSATARHYTLNGKEILGYGQMEKIDIPDNNIIPGFQCSISLSHDDEYPPFLGGI
jgi:hypothetical protein